jgi:hypothetical protein
VILELLAEHTVSPSELKLLFRFLANNLPEMSLKISPYELCVVPFTPLLSLLFDSLLISDIFVSFKNNSPYLINEGLEGERMKMEKNFLFEGRQDHLS